MAGGDSIDVAVKVIYLKPQDIDHSPRRLLSHILREVLPWHALNHPNIVPFIGFDCGKDSARLVSEWQHNGHALQYVRRHPEADRLKLLREAAAGLAYLHGRRPIVIHSDVKPENILIDRHGTAKLTDFGLSRSLDEAYGRVLRTSTGFGGTLRYSDPVLLKSEPSSVFTDLWSFGWVVFELVTLEMPYPHARSEFEVFQAMFNHQVPRREDYPKLLHGDVLWPILEACWNTDNQKRWPAARIASYLRADDPTQLDLEDWDRPHKKPQESIHSMFLTTFTQVFLCFLPVILYLLFLMS